MSERKFGESRPESQSDELTRALEHGGFRLANTVNNGSDVRRTTFEIPEGRFHMTVGFPEFNPNDKKFFYGGNILEAQEKPLDLDFDNPLFQNLVRDLKEKAGDEQEIARIVEILDNIIQQNIKSDPSDENIERMSQILEKGQSVCSGKTLISAALLKNLRREIEVQFIQGASSKVDYEKSGFGHVWLRIRDENNVILYDPYYKRSTSYDLSKPKSPPNDPFSRYAVGAYFAGAVANQLPVKSINNVRTVAEVDGSKSIWVAQDRALTSQVFGNIDFGFETDAVGELTLENNGIFVGRGEAAGYTYPLRKLEKE